MAIKRLIITYPVTTYAAYAYKAALSLTLSDMSSLSQTGITDSYNKLMSKSNIAMNVQRPLKLL